MEETEYIYKIYHKPTGLFYCSRKGRFKDDITNLSRKGNFYESLKYAYLVINTDCKRAFMNRAQVTRYGLAAMQESKFCFTYVKHEDFEVKKYILKEVPLIEGVKL